MASIEELKSAISDGSRAASEGRDMLAKVAADAAEAGALASHSTHDSRHEEVTKALT